MRFILLLLSLLSIQPVIGQEEKQMNFWGIRPGVTVEPYYDSGEFDINVFPLVFQRGITRRLDIRLSGTVNYGIRNGSNKVSHIGLEAAIPVFFRKKEDKAELSKGLYLSPVLGISRNLEAEHTNIGAWIEPGYNLLFENNFALSLGLQLGGTYFIYDDSADSWGDHFGVIVIFGKWF